MGHLHPYFHMFHTSNERLICYLTGGTCAEVSLGEIASVVTFHHETGNLLAKIQAFVSHLIPISGGSMSALIHQMSYMFIPGWWYTYPSEKYESQW